MYVAVEHKCLLKMIPFVGLIVSGLVVTVLPQTIATSNLPSYFPKCYVDDPEISDCLLKGFQSLKPYISNGIEEIGLPSLKPLAVTKLKVRQNSRLANYTMTLTNFTIDGLDQYDIKEFQYDPNTMSFRGRIEYDTIDMTAYTEILGQIILVPLEGAGVCNAVLGPISGTFQIQGKMAKVGNVDHYNVTNVDIILYIGDGNYRLDGLFGNNIPLARSTNAILNLNSKLVAQAVTPALKELAKFGIKNLMVALTDSIPYNQLFPRRNDEML